MACFIAPMVEAIVVSIVKKGIAVKEEHQITERKVNGITEINFEDKNKMSFNRKLGWLSNLLWGGSFLLAIEHIWHGEVVLWPPFLTAMQNQEDVMPMLHEIATVGVTMAVVVTAVWGCMVLVSGLFISSNQILQK